MVVRHASPGVRLLVDPQTRASAPLPTSGIAADRAPYVLLLNADVVCSRVPSPPSPISRPPPRGGGRRAAGPLPRRHAPGLLLPLPQPLRPCSGRPSSATSSASPALGNATCAPGATTGRGRSPGCSGPPLPCAAPTSRPSAASIPAYFLYFEEVDLCWRLPPPAGRSTSPRAAEVVHAGGASAAAARAEMEVCRTASARLFYRRHYRPAHAALLDAMIRSAMRLRWVRDSLRLGLARDDRTRSRLAEDLAVWRGALKAD